ncbi:hypothetical protein E4U49_008285 [Claviceps purpurea]|nr:hypothetical protein E4U49_008285 [Claviceps purpurea]
MSQQSRFRAAASATPGGSDAGGRKRAAPSGGNGDGGGGDGPGASQAARKRKMTRWNEATTLRVLQLQPKGLLRSKLDPSRHHRSRFDQGRFGRPW